METLNSLPRAAEASFRFNLLNCFVHQHSLTSFNLIGNRAGVYNKIGENHARNHKEERKSLLGK